jgi:hypothetical protein
MFVDGPREFIVQLPGDNGQHDGEEGNHARHGNQIRANQYPDPRTTVARAINIVVKYQVIDRVFDLVVLDCGIDKHAYVIHAETNDLNRILQAQGIVDQDKLVQETENE